MFHPKPIQTSRAKAPAADNASSINLESLQSSGSNSLSYMNSDSSYSSKSPRASSSELIEKSTASAGTTQR